MSEQLTELARQSLALFDRQVSPEYAALRRTFDQTLGQAALESYEHATRQAIANREWLGEAVKLLPQLEPLEHVSHSDKPHFEVAKQSEAKLLQASILWTPIRPGSGITYPFYIVGHSPDSSKKVTNLLLYAAYSGDQIPDYINTSYGDAESVKVKIKGFRSMRVSTKKGIKPYHDYQQRAIGEIYTEKELDKLYDVTTQRFTIKDSSPGNVSIVEEGGSGGFDAHFGKPRLRGGVQTHDRLPADSFERYDVFGAVCGLAVAFGRVNEVNALLPMLDIENAESSNRIAHSART